MASNTANKTPLTAKKLLQQRTDWQRKFFNSFQFSKRCAHEAIEAAQADYDKRLKVLQDEMIARCIKLAGDKDIVQDPALLEGVRHFRVVDKLDGDGKPVFKYDLCELKPHVALALARNPDSSDEPLSQENWIYIAETALGEELKLPSEKDIETAEFELASLEDLLDQIKNTKWNKPIKPYDPDEGADLEGATTYKPTKLTRDNGIIKINDNGGMSPEELRTHMENNYG